MPVVFEAGNDLDAGMKVIWLVILRMAAQLHGLMIQIVQNPLVSGFKHAMDIEVNQYIVDDYYASPPVDKQWWEPLSEETCFVG